MFFPFQNVFSSFEVFFLNLNLLFDLFHKINAKLFEFVKVILKSDVSNYKSLQNSKKLEKQSKKIIEKKIIEKLFLEILETKKSYSKKIKSRNNVSKTEVNFFLFFKKTKKMVVSFEGYFKGCW